ncbi:MAG: IS1595 family transposase [Aestuariivirga sp.]
MSDLSNPIFKSETKARLWLEAQIWPNGPVCPHCGSDDATRLEGEAHRDGLLQCNACRQQFTATVGTVFERSKIALTKWLMAVYLLSASKKGISTAQLSRMLDLPYKTAWFMTHRIREAMKDGKSPLGGEGKTVEVDETYIGNGTRRSRMKNGAKFGLDKWKVVALVERDGKARSVHVDFLTANKVRSTLVTNVDRNSDLMTDESNIYTNVGQEFASHQTVNHSIKEYGRGEVTTNTVEGFFSIFKRGMRGIYQHCGEAHLHRYLAEFDFRYSHRVKLGYSDMERANMVLKGIVGKRLMYRQSY